MAEPMDDAVEGVFYYVKDPEFRKQLSELFEYSTDDGVTWHKASEVLASYPDGEVTPGLGISIATQKSEGGNIEYFTPAMESVARVIHRVHRLSMKEHAEKTDLDQTSGKWDPLGWAQETKAIKRAPEEQHFWRQDGSDCITAYVRAHNHTSIFSKQLNRGATEGSEMIDEVGYYTSEDEHSILLRTKLRKAHGEFIGTFELSNPVEWRNIPLTEHSNRQTCAFEDGFPRVGSMPIVTQLQDEAAAFDFASYNADDRVLLDEFFTNALNESVKHTWTSDGPETMTKRLNLPSQQTVDLSITLDPSIKPNRQRWLCLGAEAVATETGEAMGDAQGV